MRMGILIYGTGMSADSYIRYVDMDKIIGFVDNSTKQNFHGKPVFKLEEIPSKEWDEIHVAAHYLHIVLDLFKANISKSKIVIANLGLYLEYYNYNGGNMDLKSNLTAVVTATLSKENILGGFRLQVGDFSSMAYKDYCRLGTLQLLTNEIKERNIEGDVAELGVYQGDFAKYINQLLPNKILYLFDTFEGFPKSDLNIDQSRNFINNANLDWANTSISCVMDKMKFPEKVVVKKGIFPDTVSYLENISGGGG